MNPIYRYMYTRPGSLRLEFEVYRKTSRNRQGYLSDGYEATGETIKGIISIADNSASERTKHLWDQDQHSLTHVIAVSGRADVRKDDKLVCGDKAYLVLITDNIGMIGGSSLVYLEERNDIK